MSSVAFALQEQARLLLVPPCRADRHYDAAGFTRRCGLVSCHRLAAMLSLRFDGGVSPDAGSQLPGTLASPRTGLAPAGCPQLVARLRHVDLLVVMAPELLDALLYVPLCAGWPRTDSLGIHGFLSDPGHRVPEDCRPGDHLMR